MMQVFAVIGDPIVQSKSPLMHRAAYQAIGYDATYVPFHVTAEQLPQAIAGMRALGIAGMNVTIPHKVAVMGLLDEMDPLAAQIGAVNTIVNREGHLVGYNTDGIGYVRSLREETGFDPSGKKITVIGAGGACRAIVFALAQAGAQSIRIHNRTIATATDLAQSLRTHFALDAHGLGNEADLLAASVAEADLIINTTSIGMYPNVEDTPIDSSILKQGQIISDLIYNPLLTRWLQDGQRHGAIAHGGLGMFVYQGAFAFEYWTGLNAPVEAMREAVLRTLQG